MFDWLVQLYNQFTQWLSERFDSIDASLNPVGVVNTIAQTLANLLPNPNPNTVQVINAVLSAFNAFLSYIALADYFINVPFLLVVVTLMFTIENALIVVRIWRFIRSFVT